jgi:hypothetical protein
MKAMSRQRFSARHQDALCPNRQACLRLVVLRRIDHAMIAL